jgi:hypothetical protein
LSTAWQPANQLEQALLDARRRDDQPAYLASLTHAPLLLPVPQGSDGWVSSAVDGRTYVFGYTSPEALLQAYGGRPVGYREVSWSWLAQAWPDAEWWLAVDPGTPIEAFLPASSLTEIAQGPPAAVETPVASAGPEPLRLSAVVQRPPVNGAEDALLAAVRRGDTDGVLKTLLLSELIVPIPDDATPHLSPMSPDFRWRLYESGGEVCVPVFTSSIRCTDLLGDVPTTLTEGLAVVHRWPDPAVTLSLNPGSEIGASLPGPQVVELAGWAARIGLIDVLREAEQTRVEQAQVAQPSAGGPLMLRKVLPSEHVPLYLQRGYDLVSGLVHRAGADPGPGHLLRWPAFGDGRYGGSESPDGRIRVSGVRLPHGTELCQRDTTGSERVIATYDADARRWRPAEAGDRR